LKLTVLVSVTMTASGSNEREPSRVNTSLTDTVRSPPSIAATGAAAMTVTCTVGKIEWVSKDGRKEVSD
jgi:hypothetical protein